MTTIYQEHFREDLDPATAASLFKASVTNVEVAISSYCNRVCSYCPNTLTDRRSRKRYMDDALFGSVVRQLGSIGYCGLISLHRYNEPLADKEYALNRIRQVRAQVPQARLRIYSNGDYWTADFLARLKEAGVAELVGTCHAVKADHDHEMVLRRQHARLLQLGLPFYYLPIDATGGRTAVVDAGVGIKVEYTAQNFAHRKGDGSSSLMLDRGGSLSMNSQYLRAEPCIIPFTEYQIEWDGRVLPCCNIHPDLPQHRRHVVGEIRADSDIFKVWTGRGLVEWRKEMFSYQQKGGACTRCNYGCIGDSVAQRAFVTETRRALFEE